MTRPYFVRHTCEKCGYETTAESSFGRWMRNEPQLSSDKGVVRSDVDHIVVRYKTNEYGRELQLMMAVEVKEYGREPDPCQRDILSFFRQIIERKGKNMYGAATVMCHKLRSRMLKKTVSVRWHGFHLLQFEKTNPDDSDWIKWDGKIIDKQTLIELLLFERMPEDPSRKLDLRDHHKRSNGVYDQNDNLLLRLPN